MKGVVRIAADGTTQDFKSVAKAAEGSGTTPYLVKEAIKSLDPLQGFRFLYKDVGNQAEGAGDEVRTDATIAQGPLRYCCNGSDDKLLSVQGGAQVQEPPEDAPDSQAGPSTALQVTLSPVDPVHNHSHTGSRPPSVSQGPGDAVPEPVSWQQGMLHEQPAADRLSQALKNFGLGVVTMQEHGTPVPYGYFWVTAMCQAAGECLTKLAWLSTCFLENLCYWLPVTKAEMILVFPQGADQTISLTMPLPARRRRRWQNSPVFRKTS